MEQEQHFIDYIEQSIIRNWNLNALTDYKGATLQYKDVARKIAKFHIVLESAGIQPGDKIAVCGRNSAHWVGNTESEPLTQAENVVNFTLHDDSY